MNLEEIQQTIEKHQIKWIQLHFTDLFGRLKILHLPVQRFLSQTFIDFGFGFDGSSVGYTTVDKSDMIAIPDLDTFLILPHEAEEARVIADLYDTSLKPSLLDSRYVLKQAITKAKQFGFDEILVSPEMEFFIIDNDADDFELKNNRYLSPPPFDSVKYFRKSLSNLLIKNGYTVKYHHHESGTYQQEIEICRLGTLEAADFCIYFKFLARELAKVHNLKLTFMPKPLPLEPANGMHAHISLVSVGKNAFYNEDDEYHLSETARYFIGGILDHAKSIAAIANPTVNSYKRLVPHYEAPVFITWAKHNRSSLIRIAAQQDVDIEVRNADPTANPYLYYSALIYAGLDGIKHKTVHEPLEKNIYTMDSNELKTYKIERLPANLLTALEELHQDDLLRKTLGKNIVDAYLNKKHEEWNKFMTEISETDYTYYLNY